MSTLSQVLSETRLLVTRLHDREKLVDYSVKQSQSLNEKINVMKEYQEDLHELNNLCHHKPRSGLVHSLQQENRQIRQLQADNRNLKVTLDEHQQVLEMIMQKHRKMVLKVMQMSQLQSLAEKAMDTSVETSSETLLETSRVFDLARILNECLLIGEKASNDDHEELVRLRCENVTLRQLLGISIPNNGRLATDFARSLKIANTSTSSCSSKTTVTSVRDQLLPSSSATVTNSSEAPKQPTGENDSSTKSLDSGPATPTASPQHRRTKLNENNNNNNNNNNDNIAIKTVLSPGKRVISVDKTAVNGVSTLKNPPKQQQQHQQQQVKSPPKRKTTDPKTTSNVAKSKGNTAVSVKAVKI